LGQTHTIFVVRIMQCSPREYRNFSIWISLR